MVRCEQETVCASAGLRYRDPSRNEPNDARDVKEMPEIVTTAAVGSADNGSPGNTPPVSPHVRTAYSHALLLCLCGIFIYLLLGFIWELGVLSHSYTLIFGAKYM